MDVEHEEVEGLPPEILKQAKEMGWTPEEEFIRRGGDPEKWVDADEFVRRGEQLMPLLRSNNKRLKESLAQRDAEIDKLRRQLDNVQGTLDRLDAHYSAANKRAAEQAITGLKNQLREAREDGDVDKEVELLRQIGLAQDEVNRISAEADKEKNKDKKPVPNNNNAPALDPELVEWQEMNEWFGTDAKKTKQFNRIAEDLREELNERGEELLGVKFLERCQELWNDQFGDKAPPSKTDASSRSGGGGNSGNYVKGWNNLPKEAKEACLADADYLVGENKRFKTLDDWKKEYTRIYNAS